MAIRQALRRGLLTREELEAQAARRHKRRAIETLLAGETLPNHHGVMLP